MWRWSQAPTGQRSAFVIHRTADNATVCTDEHPTYKGLPFTHEGRQHGGAAYVRSQAHTLLKRAYGGTFFYISAKHLDGYSSESQRPVQRRPSLAANVSSGRLSYRDLPALRGNMITDNILCL